MNPLIAAALAELTLEIISVGGPLLVAYISVLFWRKIRAAARA